MSNAEFTAKDLTAAQRAALADYFHGDSVVRIEAEHDGAVLVTLETMTMIVEADGTILDDTGEVRYR